MKTTKLLTIFSILMLFSSCTESHLEEDTKNDLEKENLKGKIRLIHQNSYYTKETFGEVTKTDLYEQIDSYFNEHGYLTKENKRYNSSNVFSYEKRTFQHDEQNNIIELNYETDSRFGKSKGKTTYKYDSKGNKLEENWYNSKGELEYKYTYKYDSKGNKVEKNSYNSEEKLKERIVYKYDAKGNEVETIGYDSEGKFEGKIVYEYDDKGNKIAEIQYNSEGKFGEKFIYEYDIKGNKIAEIWYNSEEKIEEKEVYLYDKKGNEIGQKRYNADNALLGESTVIYDKNQNKIEVQDKGYNSQGKLLHNYLVKYDEKGNILLKEDTNIKEIPESIGLISMETQEVQYVYYDTKIDKESYVYDKYNNITEEVSYKGYFIGNQMANEVEIKSNHTYQFDSKGNWILKTSTEKGKVWSITERTIEYYD